MNILWANFLDKSAHWVRKISLGKINGGGGLRAPVSPGSYAHDSSRFSHSDCGSSPVETNANNIVWRKIVAHSGLEPATFGLQTFRFLNWATSANMQSGIFKNFYKYCIMLYIATMLHVTA